MDNIEEKNEYYYKIRDIEIQKKIRSQWKHILANKSYKAQLNRCNNVEEIRFYPDIKAFKEILPQWTSYEATAVISGILANVKEDGRESLGKRLATKKGDRPVCSEEKLRLLLSSKNWDELYKNLRRLVTLIKGNVDPLSIVDFVLQWEDENRNIKKPNYSKSLKFKIYKIYYTQN